MKKATLTCAAAITMTCAYPPVVAAEGWLDPMIDKRTNLHFASDRSKLRATVVDMKERGRIVIDVETYYDTQCASTNSDWQYKCRRYTLISTKNVDNLLWEIVLPYDKNAYSEQWKEFEGKNFRLADIEDDGLVANTITALFVQNSKKLKWASFSSLSLKRFKEEYKKRVTDGKMTLIDHEVFEEGGKKRHAVIFAKDKSLRFTLPSWRLSYDDYAKLATFAYDRDNLRPLYMNAIYSYQSDTYYTTFMRDNSTDAKVFTRMTRKQLNTRNANLREKGYRLIDIEVGATGIQGRWRGTWLRRKKPIRTD